MLEFAAEILRRFGLKALAFAIGFCLALWLLAHIVAAPSSEVSILWGLVKYTKKTELSVRDNMGIRSSPEPDLTSVVQEVSTESVTPTGPTLPSEPLTPTELVLPAIELFIRGDVPETNFEKTLNSIRSDKNLRQLNTAESGRQMREIPSGTYFFFLGRWLNTGTASWNSSLNEKIDDLEVTRYRTSDSYVEIQYPQGENLQLILFVDEPSAQRITRLSGAKSFEVTAAVSPWGNSKTLISVPIDRVLRSRARDVEPKEGDWRLVLDMVIR